MLHFIRIFTVCYDQNNLQLKIYFLFGNITCDPSVYTCTKDYPKFIASNQMEKSIILGDKGFTTHADASSGARDLNFCHSLHPYLYLVYATSKSSGNTVHMCRLMCRSRKFCQRGSNFDIFFLLFFS